MDIPRIDVDRLMGSITALSEIGRYADERSGLFGVNRLALTDADRDGRRQVRQWFTDAGLAVRTDRIGNVYGRRAGHDDTLAPVLCGSHIDSVPTGGAFDGALGVLGALEVVRTLNDAGRSTRRPLEIAFFTDEEGARFGTDMLGSAVATGRIALADAYAKTDKHGHTVKDELTRIGFLGDAEERIAPPHAYVELHIEQGPILAHEEMDLGTVTGVQGISWWELTVDGRSAHAGTTPMSLRRDPAVATARVALFIHELATGGAYGAEMRATMGRIDPSPGLVNIVPGQVISTIDLRNPDEDALVRAETALHGFLTALEATSGCTVRVRQTARTEPVAFDPRVLDVIDARMRAHGHAHRRILSGAGHDAQEMAALCPTGMIFVPGLYDGISHNPRELSTPEACGRGAQILCETLLTLLDDG